MTKPTAKRTTKKASATKPGKLVAQNALAKKATAIGMAGGMSAPRATLGRAGRPVLKGRAISTTGIRGARVTPAVKFVLDPFSVFKASQQERVAVIRTGVPARKLDVLADNMGVSKDSLYEILRLPRSSMGHKIRQGFALSPEQSERVVGLEKLIGQVQALVNESGNPEGFNASRWVGEWLGQPNPALSGKAPADFMDTMEGQGIVSGLIEQTQSGAYA